MVWAERVVRPLEAAVQMAMPTLKQTGSASFSSTHMCVFHLHHISHTYVHTEDISHMHHTYTTYTPHTQSPSGSHAYKHTACCIVRIPRVHYISMLYVCNTRIVCTQCVPSHTQTRLASLSEINIMVQLPSSCTRCSRLKAFLRGSSLLGDTPQCALPGKGRVMKIFFLLSHTLLFSLLVPAQVIFSLCYC